MLTRPDNRWWIPLGVLAITVAVFLPTLHFGFVLDDQQQIVLSQPNLTWRSLPRYFTTDVWNYIVPIRTNYYRPVFQVWLMLNYQLLGLNTALWHLSAVAVHLAATLLFYFLALRLTREPFTAGAAALLFGVHPAHVESAAWISAATETLFGVFAFGTLLCHMRWREEIVDRRRLLWRAGALGLFGAAMLTKETAVVLPPLILVYEWLFPRDADRRVWERLRHASWEALPYVVIVLIYLPLRLHALGRLSPLVRPWTPGMLLATLPVALQFYVRQLLVPIQYSLFYPVEAIRHAAWDDVGLSLIEVAIAAAVLIWVSRRSRVAAFSACLLIFPLLPVLNLRSFPFSDFVHDRYLYTPLAGFAVLVAMGLAQIARPPVRAGVLFAIVALLSVVSVHAERYWSDNLTLYTRALQLAPSSSIAQEYYGGELVDEKRFAEALPVLRRALVEDSRSYSLNLYLAHCLAELGQPDEAMNFLHDAIPLAPRFPEAYVNLGMMELKAGRLDEAESHIRTALKLRRRSDSSAVYDRYHYYLGAVLEAKKDLPGALAEYQAELNENPQMDDVRDRVLDLETRIHSAAQ